MAKPHFKEFESRDSLAQSLAQEILDIHESVKKPSLLAFSGGSTPRNMLGRLNGIRQSLILMVDDRWVENTNDRSNEALLREHLGNLKPLPTDVDQITLDDSPWILPLHRPDRTVEEAAAEASTRLGSLGRSSPDMCVLGMGTDGHTASWFPGGDNLSAVTQDDCPDLYMPMRAPGAVEPRITMTMSAIASANRVVLHIEGEEKRRVFESAMENGPAEDMPIRYVIRHPMIDLHVYWAP